MRCSPLILSTLFLASCTAHRPPRDPLVPPPTDPGPSAPTQAQAILEEALSAHPQSPPVLNLTYEGTITVEGHYRYPHETRETPVRMTLTIAQEAGLARLDLFELADSQPGPAETTIITGAGAAYREAPDRPWAGATAYLAPTIAAWSTSLDPRATLRAALGAALQHPGSAVVLGPSLIFDTACETIDATDEYGVTRRLLIDRDRHLLVSIIRDFGHPREGDVCDEVTYADYQAQDGMMLPTRITQHRYEEHHHWGATLTLTSAAATESIDAAHFEASLVEPEPPTTPMAAIKPIFDRVWGVELSTSSSRAFVLEFDEFLVCVEAPLDSPTGDALLAAIRSRWPGKPLRYIAFSHYHPHYTGGLRPFIAAGATILTTPINEIFVREIASRPFTFAPDALARAPVEPVIEVIEGSRVIDDGSFRVEFHDIGYASVHTDEFIATYIPSARAVLHGDLGAARTDGTIAGRARLAGLYKACTDRALALDWLVQSWPLENCKDKTEAAAINATIP